MNLLDNELVKKYFACDVIKGPWCGICGTGHPYTCGRVALRILDSMQQPIKNGERYLRAYNDGKVVECVLSDGSYDLFHFGDLRLPDKFQPNTCDIDPAKIQYDPHNNALFVEREQKDK